MFNQTDRRVGPLDASFFVTATLRATEEKMPHKTIVSPVTKTRAEELNNQITTARTARRSFLARALGAGALAFGAVSTLGCGEEADR